MTTRTFKIVDAFTSSGHVKSPQHNFNGTYTGKPVSAAKKAASFLCRHSAIHGICTIYLTIQEKTRGSANKLYHYKISRRKLPKPIVVEHAGRMITRHYILLAKSVKDMTKKTWPDPRM